MPTRGARALTRLLVLLPVLSLIACSSSSEVAELSPDTYGLTAHGNTSAQAARVGVERARAYCAGQDRNFEVTRSQFSGRDYTIAFHCPRPDQTAMLGAPAATVFSATPLQAEIDTLMPPSARGTPRPPALY